MSDSRNQTSRHAIPRLKYCLPTTDAVLKDTMNPETIIYNAIWTPSWYELDQSLLLGERQVCWFFENPPDELRCQYQLDVSNDFVFFNRLDVSQNCIARYARIVELFHPQMGPLLRIDTDGLDYIFYPVLGEEIVVNAEEQPGRVNFESFGFAEEVNDWTVHVKLADLSEPIQDIV